MTMSAPIGINIYENDYMFLTKFIEGRQMFICIYIEYCRRLLLFSRHSNLARQKKQKAGFDGMLKLCRPFGGMHIFCTTR